jgi:hypothetical protein
MGHAVCLRREAGLAARGKSGSTALFQVLLLNLFVGAIAAHALCSACFSQPHPRQLHSFLAAHKMKP